jgi:hypothetical protein
MLLTRRGHLDLATKMDMQRQRYTDQRDQPEQYGDHDESDST